MPVCKQMLLAIFVIPFAFRAEAEFQCRIIQFRPAADGTFMLVQLPIRTPHLRLSDPSFKISSPLHLMRGHALEIP